MTTDPGPKAMVVLCTAPAEGDVAARLARGLVDARLVACVNVLPGVRSFYRWEGEVADDGETLLVIKTVPEQVGAVSRWLADAHPYDVPEVIALPVSDGAASYLSWVAEESKAQNDG